MIIPQGNIDTTKGVWKGARAHEGTRTALMSCPECGFIFSLSQHGIHSDGSVIPSVVNEHPIFKGDEVMCPLVRKEMCAFHQSITLEGWIP